MNVLTATALATGAAAGSEPYIAQYMHDKAAAFSITCDDGYRHQVNNTRDILDPLGLQATFFIMPHAIEAGDSGIVTWDEVRALQAAGHEAGTHARITHKLHLVTPEVRDSIINGGYRLIKERTGTAPVSWANPGGSKLTPAVRAVAGDHHYFIRSRKVLPDANIGGYGSTPGKRQWSDEKGRQKVREALENGIWRIVIMHSIVKGWSPFKSKDEARTHFEWVAAQKDLWIAPFGIVGRYVYERDAAQLAVHARHDHVIEFSVTTGVMPDSVFNLPLTVVIPETAAGARAVCTDGTRLSVAVEPGKILVDVPPDGRRVRVGWTE